MSYRELQQEAKDLKIKATGTFDELKDRVTKARKTAVKKSALKERKVSPKVPARSTRVWMIRYEVGDEDLSGEALFWDKEDAIVKGLTLYKSALQRVNYFGEEEDYDDFLEGADEALRSTGREDYRNDVFIALKEYIIN